MRGPFDDTQDNQGSLTEGGAASVQTARSSRKPPGGKALLRLLDLLESRGLSEAADATVAAAVPEEQKADYAPGSPLRMTPAPEAVGGAASLDQQEPGTMSAPATASAYMAAAEEGGQASGSSGPLTGPPTATGPQWRSLGPWTIPNGQTYGVEPRQCLRPRLGHCGGSDATRRTCFAARRAAASGRASTAAPAGSRAPTTPPP